MPAAWRPRMRAITRELGEFEGQRTRFPTHAFPGWARLSHRCVRITGTALPAAEYDAIHAQPGEPSP